MSAIKIDYWVDEKIQAFRKHQLRCLGIITHWAHHRLIALLAESLKWQQMALEETPEAAAVAEPLSKATRTTQKLITSLHYLQSAPAFPNEPLQTEFSSNWDSRGLLTNYILNENQPLITTLTTQLLIAAARIPNSERAFAHLRVAIQAVERAALLVQNMLIFGDEQDFSPLESETTNRMDITAPVQETVELLLAIHPQNITIHSRLRDRLPLIHGSTSFIRLLLMELILNAVDAVSPDGGEIFVSSNIITLSHPMEWIGANTAPPGDYITLTITDNGKGMHEEEAAGIFLPAFSTKADGNGMGLPLVLEIIHYFQGALQFESFPGKGTTFHLFLPANITTQKSQFQRESDMVFNNNFSGKTVLLIEDNKTLLTSLTFLLEEAGCEVFTAKDGQEAVDLFVEHQDALELIILDMNLPVIHGADVFRQIKERKPEMKIIISSSYNMQDINHFLGGPDLAPVLRKPYEIKTLLQKLEFIFAE